MQIIIKNRFDKADPLVLSNLNVKLTDLLLSLVTVPEEKRSKIVSFFSRKIHKTPNIPVTADEISKMLCKAVDPTVWNIPRINGQRLAITLKGFSAYWNTLEIDETSYFKHRVYNPKLLENLIKEHSKPMQTILIPPEPKPVITPPIEAHRLKLKPKADLKPSLSKLFLFSGIIGASVSIALFFFGFSGLPLLVGGVFAGATTFMIVSQFQKNKPKIRDLPSKMPPSETLGTPPLLPPKKPLLMRHDNTVHRKPSLPDTHLNLKKTPNKKVVPF